MVPFEREVAEELVRRMLLLIEPANELRSGIVDTPRRVVKSWAELYAGYTQDPAVILKTTFEQEGYKVDEIILCKNIEFSSMCEHHVLPFRGRAHVGYIPGERVVGLSKLARLVDCFARRLQIQEKLTNEIADQLEKHLNPLAVGVVVEAQHLCMCARGVSKQSSSMVTSALRGAFKENDAARQEFLSLIK